MGTAILEYLKSGVEPFPHSTYGDGYRCSVYLKDGTFLPCVMLRKSSLMADLAIRRFAQEQKRKGIFTSGNGYESIVKHFVTTGNRVNHHDIERIESSKFAIPVALLRKIQGETWMAWTGFVFEMRDGNLFSYGTSFGVEFFDLPDGYNFEDVAVVHNHAYVSSTGQLCSLTEGATATPADYDRAKVFRERPYFVCHYDA